MNNNKSKRYVLTALLILSFSTILPSLAYAAPLAQPDADWQYVNGNSWGWNYNAQTQISKANVDKLEVKWIFPIASKAVAPAAIQSLALQEGAQTPPIVKDGIVYITTNFLKTYAVDAKTGKQIWTHDYTFDINATQKRLPWMFGGLLTSHLHGIRYWEGQESILYEGMACDVLAINGKTGEEKIRINDLCANIPGNLYKYRTSPTSQANLGTYDKGGQLIIVMPGLMHSTTYVGDARHVTMGINVNTKQVIWRVFSFPPQDVTTKDWALQECAIGFFQTLPCTEVAAKNKAQLEWDWAFPNEKPSPYGGVTSNWGTLIVDEDTGILYTNTGNQGPYSNMTLTPGPRLYGSTLMAIDLNTGVRKWWVQPFPHDPYDYDCNWGGILAETTTLGKVYMKGCKEGYLWILNAETGKPIYAIDVIVDQIASGQLTAAGAGKEPKDGGARYHRTDPLSDEMRNWNFITDGRVCKQAGDSCKLYPSFFNGIFATDMTYDPTTQTLFHYANAATTSIAAERSITPGANILTTKDFYPWNASIHARDVATGKVKWTWYYPFSAQRAAMVVTNDILFSGFTDGSMKFFDKDKGTLLSTINVGSPVAVGPTIGKDNDGNSKIFVIAGLTSIPQAFGQGYGPSGPTTPGTLLSLGLNTKAAAAVTSTQTQTSTTTVVSSVTESTGLPSEITYAAIGIAVIAIAAAAYLMMRKRA